MGKEQSKGLKRNWRIWSKGKKIAVVTAVFLFVAGSISLPTYFNHQHQQALILAQQQEQERIAAEQAEAERVAAEEQAKLELEAQLEAERLAAEAEASRLEAERVEKERIAAEEEQARLEAEAQAEAERIAVEEAAAAEQAWQQVEAAEQAREEMQGAAQQSASNDRENNNSQPADSAESAAHTSAPGSAGNDNSQTPMMEPTSGKGREEIDRMGGGVWVPELEGWVFISKTGKYEYIYKNGGSSMLEGENLAIAKKYLK